MIASLFLWEGLHSQGTYPFSSIEGANIRFNGKVEDKTLAGSPFGRGASLPPPAKIEVFSPVAPSDQSDILPHVVLLSTMRAVPHHN